MDKEIKIKVWGLFNFNKKQFIIFYIAFSVIFIVLAIIFHFIEISVNKDAGKIVTWISDNFSLFWIIMFLLTVIEGQFYWAKFAKKQLNIIESQNAEIIYQKEEIKAQSEEIISQKDEAIAQKEHIQEQNKLITSSIYYAQRIQKATLPLKDNLNKIFENFILFMPKDIVSGDFYWFRQIKKDEKLLNIIVAADCTGHGVPGAFVSMLGISMLNEIVGVRKITKSNQILNHLRNEIKKSLHQQHKNFEQQDGMDIALSVIDKQEKTIDYSGANNSLYICTQNSNKYLFNNKKIRITKNKNKALIDIRADRMPVGIYSFEKSFSAKKFKYFENDIIYMFSDGYIDQFGGKNNEKFMTKRFKKFILNICNENLTEQKNALLKKFNAWKGNNMQIDDILVFAVKLN